MNKELVQQILDKANVIIEPLVKAEIEKQSDALVDMVLAKIEELIPGHVEDGPLALAAPSIKKSVKDALMKLADGISDQV